MTKTLNELWDLTVYFINLKICHFINLALIYYTLQAAYLRSLQYYYN